MMDLLLSDEVPSPRDSVIVSLAHACGVSRRMPAPLEYEEVEERIELISRLELVTRGGYRRHSQRELGGGWPKASGRLPVVGHALKLSGDLHAFCTEQYLKHGPVFEVSALGTPMW